MKKIGFLFLLSLILTNLSAQQVAVKTNALYAATTTFNLSAETAISNKFTIDITGGYNPWEFSKERSLKHWAIQPEARYWLHQKFYGHFLGVHGTYTDYDIQYLDFPFGFMKNRHYDGYGVGGGISYGYNLPLSKHWNIEFNIGLGYMYFRYDKYYKTSQEEEHLGLFKRDYFGPTKAGVSIVYIIK